MKEYAKGNKEGRKERRGKGEIGESKEKQRENNMKRWEKIWKGRSQ